MLNIIIFMSIQNRSAFQGHPFHLVFPSPWPILTCVSLLNLNTLGVLTMHGFQGAGNWLFFGFIFLLSSMFFWFRDVISEETYIGNHTLAVQKGLNMGVALFIVSGVSFFLAISWAYFHGALSPTVELSHGLFFGLVLVFSSALFWVKHLISKSTCRRSNTLDAPSHFSIVGSIFITSLTVSLIRYY